MSLAIHETGRLDPPPLASEQTARRCGTCGGA